MCFTGLIYISLPFCFLTFCILGECKILFFMSLLPWHAFSFHFVPRMGLVYRKSFKQSLSFCCLGSRTLQLEETNRNINVSHTWISTLFYSVQFSRSVMSDSLQPHGLQHARPPCPSPTSRLMSINSMMPSNHLILYRPLFLLPSTFPSIRVFSSELVLCIRWPKY